jgi:hypothetical protein
METLHAADNPEFTQASSSMKMKEREPSFYSFPILHLAPQGTTIRRKESRNSSFFPSQKVKVLNGQQTGIESRTLKFIYKMLNKLQ